MCTYREYRYYWHPLVWRIDTEQNHLRNNERHFSSPVTSKSKFVRSFVRSFVHSFVRSFEPTYLLTYLLTYILNLPTHLPTYLPTYLLTYLPTYLHLPTYLPTYLPTFLLTYLPVYLPTCGLLRFNSILLDSVRLGSARFRSVRFRSFFCVFHGSVQSLTVDVTWLLVRLLLLDLLLFILFRGYDAQNSKPKIPTPFKSIK